MLSKKVYRLKVTFVEKLLGSQPGRDTPASEYLASIAKPEDGQDTADEAESLPVLLDKGTTGFHVDANGQPMLYNYHVKGMLKEAAGVLNGLGGIKNLRSKIACAVLVEPRRIALNGKRGDALERPLRAQTMQGPRTALARSETLEPGAWFECQIVVLDVPKVTVSEELLRDLLEYSQAALGMGQWRNSGLYGRFEYELTESA